MNKNSNQTDSTETLNNPVDEVTSPMNRQKPNPLPYPQFIILILVRFVEPIGFTMVYPFIWYMVRDFGIAKVEAEIGYYAGILTSVFALFEACTSIFWGVLSDRIGRKPVVLMGLFGSSISLFLFGLSPNYTVAVIARAMSGALNGNVGVVKSIVAELTDETNRAEAFGYLALCFGFGMTVGPLIGGFLSNPAKKFPSLFGEIELFKKFPYFLPCAVASTLCLAALVFGALYLDETLESKGVNNHETSPLKINDNNNEESVSGRNYGTLPSSSDSANTAALPTTQSISLNAWIAIISYAMLLLFIVMCDETIIFWGASSEKEGGFGFDSSDFATFMCAGGISMFALQFTVFTAIKQRFSMLTIYQNIYLFLMILCILVPFSTSVAAYGSIWSKILVCLSYMIRSIFGFFAFNACNVLLANSTPNKSMLGLVNGISITLSCITRAIAPTLAGYIFYWSLSNNIGFPFDIHFTFFVIAFVALINHIIAQFIKDN